MSEHGNDNGFHFSHDGEHGRNCTGYGCDCDHKNYPRSHRHSGGGGNGSSYWIIYILALIIGYGINELLGVIIMIGLFFWICVTS